MSDRSLLPFILPNVFHISKTLCEWRASSAVKIYPDTNPLKAMIEFQSNVLPKLQPLFQVQDPPQTLLLLLDQIELFVTKTSPTVFREGVTPLLYSALESEHAMVQERGLKTVPRLCEILEYSHVKEVLFPKIAALFTRTKVLSVKCNTLICFHSMISVLDKYTLTDKLVPLLSRIKTKEPSVMIATLAVYEAMAKKVDRETLGSAIIPQLWTMSMGPLLNADQFARFMRAVKEMGTRVETEHLAHLREVKRMQEHTESYTASQQAGGGGGLGGGVTGIGARGEIDFESLVSSAHSIGREVPKDKPQGADPFGFDDFDGLVGSSKSASPMPGGTPALSPTHTGLGASTTSSSGTTAITPSFLSNGTALGSLPMGASSSSSISSAGSASRPSPVPQLMSPPSAPSPSPLSRPPISSNNSSNLGNRAATPSWNAAPLAPTSSSSNTGTSNISGGASGASYMSGGANYNIGGLSSGAGSSSLMLAKPPASNGLGALPLPPLQPQGATSFGAASSSSSLGGGSAGMGMAKPMLPSSSPGGAASLGAPPGWSAGASLTPTKKTAPQKSGGAGGAADWSDFDPLK